MDNNILKFPERATSSGAADTVDINMSNLLQIIRQRLQVKRDSNEVIVRPSVPSYDPHILPNGAMKVGELGVEDFESRFGRIQINHMALYVGYFAWRTEIEAARSSAAEVEFHQDLLKITESTLDGAYYPGKLNDIHVKENELIGAFAAKRIIKMLRPKHPNTIAHAARRERYNYYDAENDSQRIKVMKDFTSKLLTHEREDQINQAIKAMLERRTEKAPGHEA